MAVDKTPLHGGPYGDRLIAILEEIEAGIQPTEEITLTAYTALDPKDENMLYIIDPSL